MRQTLISVIVPVYNTSRYLKACLDSIICQSYTSLEIILIDDGSTDNSGAICDEYAKKDSRIKVFHTENGGVSRAKNYGISLASGDYLCFVDSDDIILPNHISDFVDNLSDEVDVYIQGLCFLSEDGNKKSLLYPYNGVVGLQTAFEKNDICSHGYTGEKLYKRTLIIDNNLQFHSSISFSEDLIFLLDVLTHIDKICYIQSATYQYLLHGGSVSGKYYSLESEWECLECYKELLTKLSKQCGFNLFDTKSGGEIFAMLFARVRNILYSSCKRSERLSMLNRLSSFDLLLLKKFQYINNVIVRCANMFLCKRTLKLYDLVLKSVYKLK